MVKPSAPFVTAKNSSYDPTVRDGHEAEAFIAVEIQFDGIPIFPFFKAQALCLSPEPIDLIVILDRHLAN